MGLLRRKIEVASGATSNNKELRILYIEFAKSAVRWICTKTEQVANSKRKVEDQKLHATGVQHWKIKGMMREWLTAPGTIHMVIGAVSVELEGWLVSEASMPTWTQQFPRTWFGALKVFVNQWWTDNGDKLVSDTLVSIVGRKYLR